MMLFAVGPTRQTHVRKELGFRPRPQRERGALGTKALTERMNAQPQANIPTRSTFTRIHSTRGGRALRPQVFVITKGKDIQKRQKGRGQKPEL